MRRAILAAALLACAWAHHAQSEPIESSPSAEEWLRSLSEVETAIATRTKMNADYVPGMVTVLHGRDLEAKGARTVWEALALVPGVELAVDDTGRRNVLVRGLVNTLYSSTVKILLNNVPMNAASHGIADPVFNIPMEQVERIEMIRGPGSALYGEYAFLGVLNVVTHEEDSKIFAFGGSFDTKGLGAVARLTDPDNPVQASLNLAAWRSSGVDAKLSKDLLWQYDAAPFSNAPGRANEDIKAGTAVFRLGYERFALTAQWSEDAFGDHFGINWFLPPDPNRLVEHWRHRSVTARQEASLTSGLTAGFDIGWKDTEQRRDHFFVMPDFYVPDGPDTFLQSHYLETTLDLGTDLTYRGWDKHVVLLAASASQVRVEDSEITFTPPITGSAATIPIGTTRRITALTFQDEYRHSDHFTLTTGLRYDDYSDLGSNTSPRLAGVWRLSDKHLVKLQYAEAFRSPTLFETALARRRGEADPRPATIRTSEMGYIYKGDEWETRLTGFYSELDFVISPVSDPGAFVTRDVIDKGFEVEQRWRASRQWTFEGNVSYSDPRDKETGRPIRSAAPWIVNAGFTHERGNFLGALQAHYVSGYRREPEDPRPTLAGYTTVDLTGTFALRPEGFQFRIGIKNLFDADVRFPSAVFEDSSVVYLTYPDDYPRARRNAWAQISYRY